MYNISSWFMQIVVLVFWHIYLVLSVYLTLLLGKALFQFIGEMIPKLKSRQTKSSQSDSSSQQQGTAASSKKKKGKKGKGK